MTPKLKVQLDLAIAQCLHDIIKEYCKGVRIALDNPGQEQPALNKAYEFSMERSVTLLSSMDKDVVLYLAAREVMNEYNEHIAPIITLMLVKGVESPDVFVRSMEVVIRQKEQEIASL